MRRRIECPPNAASRPGESGRARLCASDAEAPGGAPARRPGAETAEAGEEVRLPAPGEVERRKKLVHRTMRCPYCDEPLTRWKVPDTPFNEWDAEYVYVCFHTQCPYNIRSFGVMREQGNLGFSYRFMYHRERDRFYCVPDVGFGRRG